MMMSRDNNKGKDHHKEKEKKCKKRKKTRVIYLGKKGISGFVLLLSW